MTDNFNKYREFISLCNEDFPATNEKGNLDKYYVIELMRRGKDNPNLSAANYHFKNYYIYSWRDLERYEEEIKNICSLLKLRAYCSVNFKIMSQVALDAMAESARRIAAHDYKKFYNIFESCSGKYANRNNNLWVIDVDNVSTDDDFVSSLKEYVNAMESKGNGHNVVYVMPTKSGTHIITIPFNLQQFNACWKSSFGDIEICDVKKNHLTLLYENL